MPSRTAISHTPRPPVALIAHDGLGVTCTLFRECEYAGPKPPVGLYAVLIAMLRQYMEARRALT